MVSTRVCTAGSLTVDNSRNAAPHFHSENTRGDADAGFRETSGSLSARKTGETALPWRGTSPPGIVRGTAAARRPREPEQAEQRAKSGYFSCRLLLRCGDYVCPLICAETRQLGPLSARPGRSVGLWVCGSRASRYVLSFITGLSRTLFALPSPSLPATEGPLVTNSAALEYE